MNEKLKNETYLEKCLRIYVETHIKIKPKQLAKIASPIIRKETAEEIFKEIEGFRQKNNDVNLHFIFDDNEWQTLKSRFGIKEASNGTAR